jgi:hypothetical protein
VVNCGSAVFAVPISGYAFPSYGFFFDAVVSAVAFLDVSAAVIVGDTDPAALAGPGLPPDTPGDAPAPIVSKPFRGPFEHAAAVSATPINAHRSCLCTAHLLPEFSGGKSKKHAHQGERAEFMSVF